MTRIRIAIILLFLTACAQAAAQRVGLTLSGGGAKGLYHIGVIRALEENGIPIDYVSGTSMGAIIGGLYASGVSAEEMAGEFASERILYWVTGRVEPGYIYFFKQMRPNAAMLTLRFDPRSKGKISPLPTHLVSSAQIDLACVDFFSAPSAAAENDFDRLFVPFRCLASDARGRQKVIFREGDLGRAIRASMTIPLLFHPMQIDSMVLYDGGMFNNFPWQVLDEDFEPDIIIGSSCAESHVDPERTNLIDQVFSLTTLHTGYDLPEGRGILIRRIFEDVNTLDFGQSEYIIRLGYEDAMAMMDEIKAKVSRRVDPAAAAARRAEYRAGLPPLVFGEYTITGLNSMQKGYVRRQLRLDGRDGHPIPYTLDQFRHEYFKLLSEGEIDSDYPDVRYDSSANHFAMGMKLHTKPSLKLMFGGNISSTALNQAYIGVEVKRIGRTAQSYNVDGYFSSFYSSVAAAMRYDFFIRSSFFAELGFTYNYFNYFRSNFGFLSKNHDLTYSKYNDSYFHLTFGLPVSRHAVFSVRANAGIDSYRYFQDSGFDKDVDTLDRTRFRFVGLKVEYQRRSHNFQFFPTRGVSQSVAAVLVTGREYFTPGTTGRIAGQTADEGDRFWLGAHYRREHFFPMRQIGWFSWGYLIDAALTNHADFRNSYATNISSPAFQPTSHSKIIYLKEFRSASYVGAGVIPTIEMNPNFYFKMGAYAFLPDNFQGTREGIRQRLRYIFDGTLVYQTLIGPISLSLSKYDVSRNNWFITFNFGYAIFNRKGLFY